ncbi:MAG: hypothetical protein R6X19_07395 [Kiritimatiellia bacterium]
MKQFGRRAFFLAMILTSGFALTGCETSDNSDDDDNDNRVVQTAPANDRARIIGTWKVVTPWRWSKMTFNADGSRSVVDRLTGEKLSRGTWSLQNGKLVVVSDVTEEWDYTVTATTLTATLPSGSVIEMVKKQ